MHIRLSPAASISAQLLGQELDCWFSFLHLLISRKELGPYPLTLRENRVPGFLLSTGPNLVRSIILVSTGKLLEEVLKKQGALGDNTLTYREEFSKSPGLSAAAFRRFQVLKDGTIYIHTADTCFLDPYTDISIGAGILFCFLINVSHDNSGRTPLLRVKVWI